MVCAGWSASAALSFWALDDLDEFPAFPDCTIPFLGGMNDGLEMQGFRGEIVVEYKLIAESRSQR